VRLVTDNWFDGSRVAGLAERRLDTDDCGGGGGGGGRPAILL